MDHLPAPKDEDLKRSRVLDGAMRVFLSYGYKRVTMDDIAQAADMSRPALYLVFRNKADIYRAIGQRMFDMAAGAIDDVMRGGGTLSERLNMAIEQIIIEMLCQIHESPHGAELLDLKNELAAGMLEEWHASVSGVFSDAIDQETRRTGVDLEARGFSAEWLAEMLLYGLEGMKQRITDTEELRECARPLVRVVEMAVRP